MITSFLNSILPEDEHKRLKLVYFLAEAAVFTTVILLIFAFVNNFLMLTSFNIGFIASATPFAIALYVYIRYIVSGIEFTEVATKTDYQKERKRSLRQALISGTIFAGIYLLIKGVPKNSAEIIDCIALPVLFTFFTYLFTAISLKRSYQKNKDILDD